MKKVAAPFVGRTGLAQLLVKTGKVQAVEVGTDRGYFAREFLKKWHSLRSNPPGLLWCIDPYESYDHMPWDRTPDLMMAVVNVAQFVPYVQILKMDSEGFLKIRGGLMTHIGMIYIDGDHTKAAVEHDLNTWWPRLFPGTILAGHDWDNVSFVNEAVTEFATKYDLTLHIVSDPEALSWYVIKP